MDQTILQDRLKLLNPDYKEIILGDFVNKTTEIFANFLHLSEEQFVVLENGLTLYFLLFFSKPELIIFLIKECKISIPKAFEVTDMIESYLPDEMRSGMAESYKKLDNPTEVIKSSDIKNVFSNKTKPVQEFFIFSQTNGLNDLKIKHGIIAEMSEELTLVVGDIILGFYHIEDTVPLLQQELGVDPRTAALLGADVLDFLAPLSDPNWEPPVEKEDSQTDSTPEVNPTADTDNYPLQTAPAQTATIPNTNEPSRPQTHPSEPPYQAPPQYTPPSINQPPSYQAPQSPAPTHYEPRATATPTASASLYDTERPVRPEPPQSENFHYEPVYQSSQPTTRAPLSDIPTYQQPQQTPPAQPRAPLDPPRWGTG